MTSEREIQNAIRNGLVDDCLLFRVNVGQAWTGDRIEHLPGGRVLIHGARPFKVGLPPGFSDTFGLVPVTITPDMVGQTVGIFLAIECKSPTGRPTDKQSSFLQAINNNGGRAGIARSVDEAKGIVHASGGVPTAARTTAAQDAVETEATQARDALPGAAPARRAHRRQR